MAVLKWALFEGKNWAVKCSRRSTSLGTVRLHWSLSGQHTGLTDLPLTDHGENNARHLGDQLRGRSFAKVFTSPLQRARRTCEPGGFGAQTEVDRDLVEWSYGEYEGLRTEEIRAKRPGWKLFRDGCPGGESVGEIGARVIV